jgi:Domain of unknown function (DUF4831)
LAAVAKTTLLLAALSAGCAHLPHVRRVAKGEPKLANVIYYALPRTVVTVQATVRRQETEAGRCSGEIAWITSRFGPKAQPMRYGLQYEINRWRIATRTEPDPDAVFAMTVSADMFDDSNQAIELSPHGVLLLDSAETTGVVPQFVSSAVQLGGSLVAKAVPLAGLLPSADTKEFTDHFCKEVKKRVEEMDTAETKLIGDAVADASKRGELEPLLGEVRAAREQLLLNFTGRVVAKNDYRIQCEFTPAALPSAGEAPEQVVTLFAFDPRGGVAPAPGVRCALPAEVTADMAGGGAIKMRVRPAAGFAATVRDSAMAPDPLKDPSLYYRTASPATISIEDGASIQISTVQTIAQLGPVLWLPGDAEIRAFRARYEVSLHPDTGALKRVSLTASGSTAKAPTESSTTTGTTDATADSKKAAIGEAQNAKLEELVQERKVLEEQQKIDQLKSGQRVDP